MLRIPDRCDWVTRGIRFKDRIAQTTLRGHYSPYGSSKFGASAQGGADALKEAWAAASDRWAAESRPHHGEHGQHQEHKEEDFRDVKAQIGHEPKSQKRRDEGDDEKQQRSS